MCRSVTVCVFMSAVCVILTGSALAQVLPVRLYGDSMDEQAHALVQTSDTGFCVAGWTRSFGSGTPNASNILIVKTDRQGIPVWARMSVGEHDDEAYSMVRTSDAGYAITGWTRSYGLNSPTSDIFVVKLTANGVQQWARAFGGVADDQAYSIIQTADGGYAVCGWTMSFGAMPAPNIFVLRLNPAGLVQWMRSYWLAPTHMHDEGYSIVQTADGGYAVCGRAHATNPLAFDAFVMKLNSFGNVQWAMVASGDSADEASSVALDASGNIMVAGWTKSFGTAPFAKADAFAARFSPAGLISWSQTYGWSDDDEQVLDDRSLTRTADGNLALCALTRSRGPAGSGDNFMVMKASGATGLPLWTVSHPSSDDPGMLSDVPLPMIEMTDRSFAVAGWTNSWPSKLGGMDFMLSTFDSLGARPHCSHPEDIETDGMPWRTQEVMEELCMPLVDSFELTRVDVRLDSACFSGTGLEQGTRQLAPEPGIALRCRNGRALLTLPAPAAVHIQVFCVNGRQIADLGSRDLTAGTHEILLPSDRAHGVSLVRISGDGWKICAKSVGF